ncbi:alpha/beta fold hydrolase [Nonomuraea fuscirosea]|uniref:alpha/beta fold hydrolase n=1 Tax=Nonomuraea fuscirosea TaxID=1291556 RepID=UPI00340F0708
MTTVLVHGNPETTAVWEEFLPELARRGVDDIVLLSPPGYGAPIPDGFGCTRLEYRDWLIGRIEEIGAPVDLVGHDWGACHTYAVAAERPDLLRTWAADCGGMLHPRYEWHAAALTLQTPGEGEKRVAEMLTWTGADFVANRKIPARFGPSAAEGFDEVMGEAMLKLYRSAKQPAMSELGEQLARAPRRPGLMLHTPEDPYTNPEDTFEMAGRVGADVATLTGAAHWWMFGASDQAADALVTFWARHAPGR